jgi:hypothetical protein
MATPEQVAELRSMVNEPDATTYTDEALSARIDSAGSLSAAAASIWTEKAGRYSELVDVQEGSSKRSLGALYQQALNMASFYGEGGDASPKRASRTRRIERQ